MRLFAAIIACAAALSAASVSAQAPRNAEDIARQLQQHYKQLRDFQADFAQYIKTGQLRATTKHEGRLYVKPGRMRWDYEKPDKFQTFWDGRTIYQYYPQDKEALKSDVQADGASTSLLFLAGQGDLLRDFTPSLVPSEAQTVGLRLTPRKPDPDYESLVVVLEEPSLRLRSLTTRDRLSGEEMRFEFRNLRENTGLNDRLFVFTPPSGVRVKDMNK